MSELFLRVQKKLFELYETRRDCEGFLIDKRKRKYRALKAWILLLEDVLAELAKGAKD